MTNTQLITVTAGSPPQAITDAGNAPTGCVLINRGDNGGTLWISPGANGPAVPLSPGGSLTWTDRGTLPFVTARAGSTSEVLVVTDQAEGYTNPVAVAVATATALAAKGIPQVYVADKLFAGPWPGPANGAQSINLDVSRYASVVVSITWPNVGPTGPVGVVTAVMYDPLPAGQVSAAVFYGGQTTALSSDVVADPTTCTWVLPVTGPTLTLTALVGSLPQVVVYGTNRAGDKLRQLGEETGTRNLLANLPADTTTETLLRPWSSAGGFSSTQPVQTRHNGRVRLVLNAGTAGRLLGRYVDPDGRRVDLSVTVAAGFTAVDFAHPSVPMKWTYIPSVVASGNYVQLTVVAA